MSRGLYAYAITRDRQLDLSGPWLIGHRGLALVVAEVDLGLFAGLEFDEAAEDSQLAVLARYHDAVVRAVFEHEPVLPLRFGTVLDGIGAAVRLLGARHVLGARRARQRSGASAAASPLRSRRAGARPRGARAVRSARGGPSAWSRTCRKRRCRDPSAHEVLRTS